MCYVSKSLFETQFPLKGMLSAEMDRHRTPKKLFRSQETLHL